MIMTQDEHIKTITMVELELYSIQVKKNNKTMTI